MPANRKKSDIDKSDRPQGRDTYRRILSELRSGALSPGDRVTETEIATRLGISRTPVREAMRQLESDGLISQTPRSGTTIRQLDYSEVSELYEMRAVLESTAARFAARAASDVELEELAALHVSMCAAELVPDRFQLNQQFHRSILEAARNRFLLNAAESIEKTLLILGPSTLNEVSRSVQADKEHAGIVSAIRAREPEGAERAMREHIESAHRARLRQLRQKTTLTLHNT